MKRLFIIVAFALITFPMFAEDTEVDMGTTTNNVFQLRAGASFNKKISILRLHFDEQLRFNPYASQTGNSFFNRSHTTVGIGVVPLSFLKVEAGYTLKIYGNKDWSDVKEWMRHRVYAGLTGSVHFGSRKQMKLSLRERLLVDMRMDSVNLNEKPKNALHLRSKLGFEYKFDHVPVKPYLSLEIDNTLNAPKHQQKNGHQYINEIKATVGTRWRLNKRNALNFYYRYHYGYDRDVNQKKKNTSIYEITTEKTHIHVVGINYEFDW